ncbi:MAG TPA: hypothetical protein VJN88_00700 [Ktedonobacterales bacterium]|nr:hypothetical protein [Ktedonobacterales bacterium]
MTGEHDLYQRFAPAIGSLPDGKLSREELLTSHFLMERDDTLAIYYAPFDFVNTSARVMIVGITPGFTQMAVGYERARSLIRAGRSAADVCDEAKRAARFAGSMRDNLIAMLDGIELHTRLGIPSSATLFDTRCNLLHSTSAVRYPVVVSGANYTGHHPPLGDTPRLMRYVRTVLADEFHQVPQALIIPLGKVVAQIMEALAIEGYVDISRCLIGFPNPSGANGHRTREYRERRETLRETVEGWFATNPLTILSSQ